MSETRQPKERGGAWGGRVDAIGLARVRSIPAITSLCSSTVMNAFPPELLTDRMQPLPLISTVDNLDAEIVPCTTQCRARRRYASVKHVYHRLSFRSSCQRRPRR